MVRVIVADDHHLVRQGIRMLLEKAEDINVVGEADNGLEAVELAESLTPDIVVMDISMPRLNGIQATEQIRSRLSQTEVVVLSMHADDAMVRQALRRGARGYVLKRAVGEELLLAIRAAVNGETYLSPPIAGSIVDDFFSRSDADEESGKLEKLTRQGNRGAATPCGRWDQQFHRRGVCHQREDGGETPGQPHVQAGHPRPGGLGPVCGQARFGVRRTNPSTRQPGIPLAPRILGPPSIVTLLMGSIPRQR